MEKFGELKDKFKTAGEKIRGLEREGDYGFKASEGGQLVKGLSTLRGYT